MSSTRNNELFYYNITKNSWTKIETKGRMKWHRHVLLVTSSRMICNMTRFDIEFVSQLRYHSIRLDEKNTMVGKIDALDPIGQMLVRTTYVNPRLTGV